MTILIASAVIVALTVIAALAVSRAAKRADESGYLPSKPLADDILILSSDKATIAKLASETRWTGTRRWSFRTFNADGSSNTIDWRRIRREAWEAARSVGARVNCIDVWASADWTGKRELLGDHYLRSSRLVSRWQLHDSWKRYRGRVRVTVELLREDRRP